MKPINILLSLITTLAVAGAVFFSTAAGQAILFFSIAISSALTILYLSYASQISSEVTTIGVDDFFVKSFGSWRDTHFEVVCWLNNQIENGTLSGELKRGQELFGEGYMYEVSEHLAGCFEDEFVDVEFENEESLRSEVFRFMEEANS